MDHLGVLALEIAPGRTSFRNRSFLADLSATYAWLDIHWTIVGVRQDSVFLNVDDPETDDWEWYPASKLVFNLYYAEKERVPVRRFLQKYKKLLKTVGAQEVENAKMQQEEVLEDVEDQFTELRKSYNVMRQAEQLVDIRLIPAPAEGSSNSEELPSLWAHASFLSASIPHLKDALAGNWKESQSGEYIFYGSYFGAQAILGMALLILNDTNY